LLSQSHFSTAARLAGLSRNHLSAPPCRSSWSRSRTTASEPACGGSDAGSLESREAMLAGLLEAHTARFVEGLRSSRFDWPERRIVEIALSGDS